MKYFFFDLDGVLVNTSKIQYETLRKSIIQILNFDIECDIELKQIFNSTITTKEKLKLLYNKNLININQIEEIYELKKNIANLFFQKIEEDNDKIEMFKELKKNDCKIAVVTNGNRESAVIILEALGVYNFIDLLITNNDVKNGKPSPEPYLKAVNYFNANILNCIIFEDSEVGLISAKASGCNVYHVLNVKDVNFILINNYLK